MAVRRGLEEWLLWRETFREIVELLTESELAVAQLRLAEVPDERIAKMLGISKQAVGERMARAAHRIVRQMPEMAHWFRDRTLQPGLQTGRGRPLEQGWACSDPVALRDYYPIEARYRPSEVAAWAEVNVKLIRAWCRAGKLPGARKRDGHWWIPEEGVEVARELALLARGRSRGLRPGRCPGRVLRRLDGSRRPE